MPLPLPLAQWIPDVPRLGNHQDDDGNLVNVEELHRVLDLPVYLLHHDTSPGCAAWSQHGRSCRCQGCRPESGSLSDSICSRLSTWPWNRCLLQTSLSSWVRTLMLVVVGSYKTLGFLTPGGRIATDVLPMSSYSRTWITSFTNRPRVQGSQGPRVGLLIECPPITPGLRVPRSVRTRVIIWGRATIFSVVHSL